MSADLATIDTEIGAIEATMRSSMAVYERDPAMQSRYLALLEAKETGATPPPPVAKDETERRAIQKLMGDPTSKYWRGPESDTLQARYRALLEAAEPPSPAGEGGDEAPLLPLPRGADLTVARAAADLLGALPGDMRAGFERTFDALPSAVHAASAAELAAPVPWGGSPIGPSDLKRFGATPEGRELLSEWRHDAPVKLARLRGRLERWLSRMPLAAQDAALTWLDGLAPAEAAAVYRVVTR
jgi:hypothetical protein